MRTPSILAALLLVAPLHPGMAQTPPGQRAGGPPPPAPPSAWQHPTGPFAIVMEEDATLPNHAVYRPDALTAFPAKDRLPRMFTGASCGLCIDPLWEVRKKKIDEP
jgi:hypothetical protein